MEKEKKSPSRRKFLFWGAGLLSGASLFRFAWMSKAREKEEESVKMLTQDGRLVEVDVSRLPSQSRQIKDEELLGWATKNNNHR